MGHTRSMQDTGKPRGPHRTGDTSVVPGDGGFAEGPRWWWLRCAPLGDLVADEEVNRENNGKTFHAEERAGATGLRRKCSLPGRFLVCS